MARHRHVDPMNLWELLFPGKHLCDRLNHLEKHMSEIEDRLNEAIAQVGTDLGEAVTRIEAKLADADINLDDEIAQLRGFSDQLDAVAADPVVEEPPVDPGVDPETGLPVEPEPTEP